jgi:DNA invertase Pin-like site-specific DNA recombinase
MTHERITDVNMVMEARKFVSWRRCSTQKQGKSGLGLEAQLSIINYFVNEAQGELIADFHEVYTGKNLHGCVELQKAMECAKKNNATLVVAKTDRFRNLEQALEVYRLMDGSIYFCDVPMAEDAATYKFMLSLSWSLAEREAAITSLRTKQALQAKRDRGEAIGNPNATISATMRANSIASRRKDAQLNDNNRKAYKLASLLVAQGKTITEVSRELNENGYKTPTGKQWQTVQVQRLMALYK